MSFMCVICLDMLTNTPKDNPDIIATKCGHVFHQMCLQTWITKRRTPEDLVCPNCSHPVVETENRKLWLDQDEDTDRINNNSNEIKRKIKMLEAGNLALRTSAEEEGLLIDILKYEYEDLRETSCLEISRLSKELNDLKEKMACAEAVHSNTEILKQTINQQEKKIDEFKTRDIALKNKIGYAVGGRHIKELTTTMKKRPANK